MSFESIKNLQGQTAVVVGAGGAVGLAICRTLAEQGANIVAVARNISTDLQYELTSWPGDGHKIIQADNTKSEDLQRAADSIKQCDILVNTAGWSKTIPHKNIDELTDEFFDTMLTANLRSVFSTIRIFAPLLKNSSNALIVNIGSASALRPGHGSNIAYVAAKAGVESMTKNLALALSPKIRVISICPSTMDTGFLKLSKSWYQQAAETSPLKRIATPQDVADVVKSCAMHMRFVTGNCFVIDGGRIL